jgi:tetratricopeptide (TPR) repeat protein
LEVTSVKRIQRQAITAAGLFAVVLAPTSAMAQRNQQPVPIFLAVTFKSPGEPKLGVDVAEGIRDRMTRFFPQPATRSNSLRIVKREEINNSLTGSGYPADSAITTTDLRDLGKGMGANESMEGVAKRTADGVEVRARFYVLSNVSAPEVLPVVVEKNAEAAGRKVAELYVQARKELPAYEDCKNALIQNQPDQAVVAANEALKEYDQGVLPRACLLTAYQKLFEQKKMPLDSVMRVANEILTIDPENEIAIVQMVDAYRTRGDTAKAIEYSMKLYALNPANLETARGLVNVIAGFGAPEKALVIVDDMMKNNPGDAAVIETQWKLLQATNQWKRAIAAGEEMVKFDTSKADTSYFRRQIGAALQDSQPQLALQFLGRATTKFPRDVRLLQAYSLKLREQGQIQQALDVAKKVVAIDPKVEQGYATVVVLYTELGQADSAVAFAKQALKSTTDSASRNSIGQGLLSLVAPAMKAAQADTAATPDVARTNWTKVYQLSAAVDSIVPQPATAFYMSFAAYNLASNAATRISDLAKAKNTAGACVELKTAADMILQVDLNMARGGRFDPQNAAAILNAASQLKPYLSDVKTQLKCK